MSMLNEMGGAVVLGVVLVVLGVGMLVRPDASAEQDRGEATALDGVKGGELDLFVPERAPGSVDDSSILEGVAEQRVVAESPGGEAYRRARALAEAGDLEGAVSALTEALAKDLELWPAHRDLGRAAAGVGEHQRAIEAFTRVLEIDPGLKRTYVDRAESYFVVGEFRKAIDDCTRALDGHHANPDAYNLRGLSRTYVGDHGQAVEDFTAALRLDPTEARVFCNRAFSLQTIGALPEALADCERAIRLDAELPDAYLRRGQVHSTRGDERAALRDFDRALELAPDLATALAHRSLLRGAAKDPEVRDTERAVADAERACELANWQDWRALEVLARAYAHHGDAVSATRFADRLVALAPESQAAREARAKVLVLIRDQP